MIFESLLTEILSRVEVALALLLGLGVGILERILQVFEVFGIY